MIQFTALVRSFHPSRSSLVPVDIQIYIIQYILNISSLKLRLHAYPNDIQSKDLTCMSEYSAFRIFLSAGFLGFLWVIFLLLFSFIALMIDCIHDTVCYDMLYDMLYYMLNVYLWGIQISLYISLYYWFVNILIFPYPWHNNIS